MRRVILVALSVLVAALLGVATNIATGVLPDAWAPYLWLAWPLLILLILILAVIEVVRGRELRSAAPAPARARRVLLERVRRYWITSVLDRSLQEEARIELGIAATADDQRHPWSLRASCRDGYTTSLDHRASISLLFDQLDQAVVITGAPGAGKTTTLLELARDLLDRAEHDPDEPIPVVFNLSSWALLRRPLDQWLVEQLTERYGIPAQLAVTWVEAGGILPLLDGLDEVSEQHRDACTEAITAFLRHQSLTPIAVCCRQGEYERLSAELPVYGKVEIQPLDRSQIERYVNRPGLGGLRAAMAADPHLWKVADSPLMLSIMALAYADGTDVRLDEAANEPADRRRLFSRYVDTMLRHRPHAQYSPQRTSQFLSTLAQALSLRGQTVFLLDMVDESWSSSDARRRSAAMLSQAMSLAVISILLTVTGWALGRLPGLLIAMGMTAASVLAYVASYADLSQLSWFLQGREENKRRRGNWLLGVLMAVPEVGPYAAIAALLGAAVGGLLGYFAPSGEFWSTAVSYGVGFSLATVAIIAALECTQLDLLLAPSEPQKDRREVPSQMLRTRLAFAADDLLPLGTTVGLLAGLPVHLGRGAAEALPFGMLLALSSMLLPLAVVALTPTVEQALVRRRLARSESVPYPLLPFLDYAVQCLFLRQVGDSYIFVHRELLDFFADHADDMPALRRRARWAAETSARVEAIFADVLRARRDASRAPAVGDADD